MFYSQIPKDNIACVGRQYFFFGKDVLRIYHIFIFKAVVN